MTNEIGTLGKLDVQAGDVLECVYSDKSSFKEGNRYTCIEGKNAFDRDEVGPPNPKTGAIPTKCSGIVFRVIARAKTTVDLTKLYVPFALLDVAYGEGTQEALKAHGGPYQAWDGYSGWFDINSPVSQFDTTIYRVKPEPKIVEITSYHDIKIGDDSIPVKLNYNLVDGVIDHTSMKVTRGYV